MDPEVSFSCHYGQVIVNPMAVRALEVLEEYEWPNGNVVRGGVEGVFFSGSDVIVFETRMSVWIETEDFGKQKDVGWWARRYILGGLRMGKDGCGGG